MNKKILVVQSSYYKDISLGLRNGVIDYFDSQSDKNFTVSLDWKEAPGSFEIPFLINQNKHLYDGFIALGCIIRGETYHFEIISNEVARKIMDLSININRPIGFGILTCQNLDQAKKRSANNENNKGAEAANACLNILLNG